MEPIVVGGYLLLMNIVGLYVMYSDKRRAIKHRFRIPERTLFIVSLLGGSIGTWAGITRECICFATRQNIGILL